MRRSKFLRRLLDYCPKPSEPLKTVLKRYSVPVAVALSVSVVLTSFLLLYQTALSQSTLLPPPPLTGVEYNPGVSVGDYVVYGNFVCNREHPEGTVCIADLAFKKMEVVAVSGKEVTFLHSEQFKNGTATWNDGRTETWDVEKYMWSEDTADYVDSTLVIAANLTVGDCIQLDPAPLSDFYVAETDVRTYLSVSRNVSILRMRGSVDSNGEPCEITFNLVYDQESGIRLEEALVPLDGEVLSSMNVVETNVFSTLGASSVAPSQGDNTASIPRVTLYVVIGSVFTAVFVVVVLIPRKNRLRGGEKTVE